MKEIRKIETYEAEGLIKRTVNNVCLNEDIKIKMVGGEVVMEINNSDIRIITSHWLTGFISDMHDGMYDWNQFADHINYCVDETIDNLEKGRMYVFKEHPIGSCTDAIQTHSQKVEYVVKRATWDFAHMLRYDIICCNEPEIMYDEQGVRYNVQQLRDVALDAILQEAADRWFLQYHTDFYDECELLNNDYDEVDMVELNFEDYLDCISNCKMFKKEEDGRYIVDGNYFGVKVDE